jgi:hypothetical protein
VRPAMSELHRASSSVQRRSGILRRTSQKNKLVLFLLHAYPHFGRSGLRVGVQFSMKRTRFFIPYTNWGLQSVFL